MTDPADFPSYPEHNEEVLERASEPAPVAPSKLTREEYLEIESLSLKVQNVALQHEKLQADVIKAVQMRQDLQKELATMLKRFSEKYGVDLTKVQILPDGTIVNPAKG